MLQLRDPEAAATWAAIHAKAVANLLVIPPTAPEPPTVGEQPEGGPNRQKPWDYPAWCTDMAALIRARPRRTVELAEHYGLTVKSFRERIQTARRKGCWPPEGTREVWLFDGQTRRLTLEAA